MVFALANSKENIAAKEIYRRTHHKSMDTTMIYQDIDPKTMDKTVRALQPKTILLERKPPASFSSPVSPF